MRRRFVVHLARRAGEQRSLRVAVLCALAASTVVLGAWGWTIFDDHNANFSLDLLGATHATLALFYGEAPNGTVNLPLATARLIGPLTTAGVVLETVLQFGHRRLQSAAARSMEGHIVAVGLPDRLEVYLRPIEQADGRLLAAVQTTSDESTWRGAVVVPSIASPRRWTERLSVARARRVIVAHGSDEQNVAALSDLLDVLGRTEPAVPMQVEVELDDRMLSLTVAIWLAQHHEDLDIDIVNRDIDGMQRVVEESAALLPDSRAWKGAPVPAAAVVGDSAAASAVFDRLSAELVERGSAHAGPEIPTMVVASPGAPVDPVRDRESASLRIVELGDARRCTPLGVAELIVEIDRHRVAVVVVDFEDSETTARVAVQISCERPGVRVLVPGAVRLLGTPSSELAETPPKGILAHIADRAAVGKGGQPPDRHSVRKVLHDLLNDGGRSGGSASGLAVSAGYRRGALEALPKHALERLASAELLGLQDALEDLDLYFHRRQPS